MVYGDAVDAVGGPRRHADPVADSSQGDPMGTVSILLFGIAIVLGGYALVFARYWRKEWREALICAALECLVATMAMGGNTIALAVVAGWGIIACTALGLKVDMLRRQQRYTPRIKR